MVKIALAKWPVNQLATGGDLVLMVLMVGGWL